MKILITGNMGYVGPSVIKQLRESYPDAELIGYDTGYFAHCLTNAICLPECRVDAQYFADIREVRPDILNGINAIVYLAAISNDPMGNTFEEVTADINFRSAIRWAEAGKAAGVTHFVYASSCSVYGFADDSPRNEQSKLNPLTAYARSKIGTEGELEKLAGNNFTVTCLRFATACGMSDRLRLDLVVNDFVAGAVASGVITILSDGTPWRPLIHVKDMARAIDWAIVRKAFSENVFLAINAGSDEWNYQVKELAETVAELVPGTEVLINKDAQPDNRSYKVDFSMFKELAPDHQPKVSLSNAIIELRNGLQAMRFDNTDFRSSEFIRLVILKSLQENRLLDDELRWV